MTKKVIGALSVVLTAMLIFAVASHLTKADDDVTWTDENGLTYVVTQYSADDDTTVMLTLDKASTGEADTCVEALNVPEKVTVALDGETEKEYTVVGLDITKVWSEKESDYEELGQWVDFQTASFPDTLIDVTSNLYNWKQETQDNNYLVEMLDNYYMEWTYLPDTYKNIEVLSEEEFIVNNFQDGAYYAGKTLVRVDPEYEGSYEVKEGTKVILASAFEGCQGIENVEIPDSVEYIGTRAFANSSVKHVNLPTGLNEHGNNIFAYTFYGCSYLKGVDTEGVKINKIGYAAFMECSSLESFDFGVLNTDNNYYTIEGLAFAGAFTSELDVEVDLSNLGYNSLTFAAGAFAFSNVNAMTIPSRTTVVPSYFCYGCNQLSNISLVTEPDTIVNEMGDEIEEEDCPGYLKINYSAFRDCVDLTEDCLYDKPISYIGGNAFMGCQGFTEISIPEFCEVSTGAFAECPGLTTMNIYSSGPSYTKDLSEVVGHEDNNAFCKYNYDECRTLIFDGYETNLDATHVTTYNFYKSDDEGNINWTLRNNMNVETVNFYCDITIVEDVMFHFCGHLKEVNFQNPEALKKIGEQSFYNTPLLEMDLSQFVNLEEIEKYGFALLGNNELFGYVSGNCQFVNNKDYEAICSIAKMDPSDEDITVEPYYVDFANKYLTYGFKEVDLSKNTKLSRIGYAAFFNNFNIKSVTIPENVDEIISASFSACPGIEKLVLDCPSSVFSSCGGKGDLNNVFYSGMTDNGYLFPGIKEISFSELDNFEGYRVMFSEDLEKVTIKGGTQIPHDFFNQCINLKEVSFGVDENGNELSNNTIKIIDYRAFQNCINLHEFPFEKMEALETISGNAFGMEYTSNNDMFSWLTNRTSIVFDSDLENLTEEEQTYGLYSLDLTKNKNLTKICYGAFINQYNVNGTLTIPETITCLENSAFSGMSNIDKVVADCKLSVITENYNFNSIIMVSRYEDCSDIEPFKGAYTSLWGCHGKIKELVFNNVDTDVPNSFFSGQAGLEKVTMNAAEGEETYEFMIGDFAFINCLNLKDIDLKGCKGYGKGAFHNCISLCSDDLVINGDNSEEAVFRNCISLKNITIEGTKIPYKSFVGCKALENVMFEDPEEVTEIGGYAFCNCYGLHEFPFEKLINLETIGETAFCFVYCGDVNDPDAVIHGYSFNLFTDEIYNELSELQKTYGLKEANLKNCTKLTKAMNATFFNQYNLKKLVLPENLEVSLSICLGCVSLEEVEINSVASYMDMQLCNGFTTTDCNSEGIVNTGIKKLTINNAEGVMPGIFASGFVNLETLEINPKVEIDEEGNEKVLSYSISPYAFTNCTSLKNVTIKGCESIGTRAFANCTSLENVVISEKIAYGEAVYQNCKGIKNVIVEDGVESIPDFTFNDCDNIEKVSLPESLETIGTAAFKGAIAEGAIIVIPKNVTEIRDDAFAATKDFETIINDDNEEEEVEYYGHEFSVVLECTENPIDVWGANDSTDDADENTLLPFEKPQHIYCSEELANAYLGTEIKRTDANTVNDYVRCPEVNPIRVMEVKNMPESLTRGDELPIEEIEVYVNEELIDPDNYTIDYDSEDHTLGTRLVTITTNIENPNNKLNGITYGELTLTALDGSEVTGKIATELNITSSEDEPYLAKAVEIEILPMYYTLTFDVDGGSEVEAITEAENTEIDLTQYTSEKDMFTFDGWYSDNDLTDKITSIALTDDTVIYAGWDYVYGDPIIEFSEDGTSAEAYKVALADDEVIMYADETLVTSEVIVEPTCENKGTTRYTANATFPDETTATDTLDVEDIEPLGHDWDTPVITFSEDGKTATATRVCKRDNSHVETVDAVVTSEVTVQPTCEEYGITTYTATAIFDEGSESAVEVKATKDVADIEPIGHSWGEVVITFSEDGKTATATRTCKNDSNHVETVDAVVTSRINMDPTCLEPGTTIYTATATFEDGTVAVAETTLADIDATGHSWGEVVITFAEDGKSATATRTCNNNADHVETINAVITSAVKTEPTLTKEGVTEYTATATFDDGTVATATTDVTDIASLDATTEVSIQYRTQVQTSGWEKSFVENGAVSGTVGKALRLEAIQAKVLLNGVEDTAYGSVEYRVHVQKNGWESSYAKDGATAGTVGKGLRLEAIQMRLTGELADLYDIYYRVHVQKIGWLDWAKNDEKAGTQNYAYRLEGIQIILGHKNEDGSSNESVLDQFEASKYDYAFYNKKTVPNVRYRSYLQTYGWESSFAQDSATSGRVGEGKRVEAIQIKLNSKGVDGSVVYRTYNQNKKWSSYVTDGATSGTLGKALRLEAIQVYLTGDLAEKYDIYYRAHVQKLGWLGWANNGNTAGTRGYGYRLEAFQIQLVEKGFPAPGSTSRSYLRKK